MEYWFYLIWEYLILCIVQFNQHTDRVFHSVLLCLKALFTSFFHIGMLCFHFTVFLCQHCVCMCAWVLVLSTSAWLLSWHAFYSASCRAPNMIGSTSPHPCPKHFFNCSFLAPFGFWQLALLPSPSLTLLLSLSLFA